MDPPDSIGPMVHITAAGDTTLVVYDPTERSASKEHTCFRRSKSHNLSRHKRSGTGSCPIGRLTNFTRILAA
eukprot:6932066-Prorocentrum_lima.AAC.1